MTSRKVLMVDTNVITKTEHSCQNPLQALFENFVFPQINVQFKTSFESVKAKAHKIYQGKSAGLSTIGDLRSRYDLQHQKEKKAAVWQSKKRLRESPLYSRSKVPKKPTIINVG